MGRYAIVPLFGVNTLVASGRIASAARGTCSYRQVTPSDGSRVRTTSHIDRDPSLPAPAKKTCIQVHRPRFERTPGLDGHVNGRRQGCCHRSSAPVSSSSPIGPALCLASLLCAHSATLAACLPSGQTNVWDDPWRGDYNTPLASARSRTEVRTITSDLRSEIADALSSSDRALFDDNHTQAGGLESSLTILRGAMVRRAGGAAREVRRLNLGFSLNLYSSGPSPVPLYSCGYTSSDLYRR